MKAMTLSSQMGNHYGVTLRRVSNFISTRTVEKLRVAAAVVGVLALWAGLFAGSPVVMAVATGVGLAGVLAPSAEKGGEK